jgi:PKD repeat protein
MKKITLLFAAIALGTVAKAQSFTAIYPFDNVDVTTGTTDPTPVPTATGVTFSSFTATGTPANPNATVRFSFTDWALGGTPSSDVYATHTGTMDPAEYYEVTVTPDAGYTMTLDAITFRAQRSGSGIRTYAVRSSVDGFASNLDASISPANPNLTVETGNVFYWAVDATTTGQNGSTVTLGGAPFTGLTGPVTFRFYGWNAELNGGTFSIDNVTINGSVVAPAALNADFSATTECEGNATVFTDMSSGPSAITTWSWDFGDGSIFSTTQNPTHTYASAGTYNVTLTVSDASTTDSYTTTVTVNPAPVAMFLSSANTVCSGSTVVFSDVSTISSGTITAYSWNFGDPASGSANTSSFSSTSHTYYTDGSHLVTHIVTSDLGCSDTTSSVIEVDSTYALLPYTQAGMDVTFAGTANNGTGPYVFEIDPGDGSGFSITDPNATYSYTTPGVYNACMAIEDMNGCTDTVCTTITILSTGINSAATAELSILPNPSKDGIFSLSLPNSEKASVVVYNLVGAKIKSFETTVNTTVIDLSKEVNGSYFISIRTENDLITRRIIISK